jgi:coenzyme F420-0:L-glutamate ligase/coenzyme F420-1:gamma-L-glutamate ligase
MNAQVNLFGLPGIPAIAAGADLPTVIQKALAAADLSLQDGDVLVVTHKIVSKAEGRVIDLATVTPSPRALALAKETEKDPRIVELILRESRGVIRQRGATLIMETHHGWICANAGVDRSNVAEPEVEAVLLLPEDPDDSAARLREALIAATGAEIAVIISDTHGRAWRQGVVNIAIGVAGMTPIDDLRGHHDLFGYELRITTVARADELAAAAGLVIGQAAEGLPVVLIRGAAYTPGDGRATDMQRSPEQDLFR